MSSTRAIFHRTKQANIFPLGGDRYLIRAILQDEIHDVHLDVEVTYPSLEIVAARSDIRNAPFTTVCNMTAPNVEKLVGMKIGRGFTGEARKAVGGIDGCHRVSELVVEIAQAAYQLHFVLFFESVPPEVREAEDVPIRRWRAVNQTIPGMRNTCFAYSDVRERLIEEKTSPLRLRPQDMPTLE